MEYKICKTRQPCKVFISQPMNGKTEEEIRVERERIIKEIKATFGDKVKILDTLFDFGNKPPLYYLAKSIEKLSEADWAYFAPGWEEARGCKIEYECAKAYDIRIMFCGWVKYEEPW